MERDFYSHVALDTFNGMRDVNFSPSARASAIRGMFEFSSMTQKFFTWLPSASSTKLRVSLFYHNWLIKFSSARNSQTQNNAIVESVRINFEFLILIISWRPRRIYIEKHFIQAVFFVIVILSITLRDFARGVWSVRQDSEKEKNRQQSYVRDPHNWYRSRCHISVA